MADGFELFTDSCHATKQDEDTGTLDKVIAYYAETGSLYYYWYQDQKSNLYLLYQLGQANNGEIKREHIKEALVELNQQYTKNYYSNNARKVKKNLKKDFGIKASNRDLIYAEYRLPYRHLWPVQLMNNKRINSPLEETIKQYIKIGIIKETRILTGYEHMKNDYSQAEPITFTEKGNELMEKAIVPIVKQELKGYSDKIDKIIQQIIKESKDKK